MSKPESNTVKVTGYLRIDFIGKVYTCYTVTILQKLRWNNNCILHFDSIITRTPL